MSVPPVKLQASDCHQSDSSELSVEVLSCDCSETPAQIIECALGIQEEERVCLSLFTDKHFRERSAWVVDAPYPHSAFNIRCMANSLWP